jgi:subtilisin family serine protease
LKISHGRPDIACTHGTIVEDILYVKHWLSVPAICPNFEIILNQIFGEDEITTNKISNYPGGRYTQMSGTSFAAPFVTGCTALLRLIFDTLLMLPELLIRILYKSVGHM